MENVIKSGKGQLIAQDTKVAVVNSLIFFGPQMVDFFIEQAQDLEFGGYSKVVIMVLSVIAYTIKLSKQESLHIK